MPAPKPDRPLVPSLLDRLLDDEPEVKRDPPRGRHQILRELKASVRRDLEDLLNTRRRCGTWPSDLAELERSLVNYGIPDFAGANMGSAERRQDFCRGLEAVLRTCEPRFKTVQVRLLDSAELLERTLRFRIDAVLYADPAPEPVVFDSALEPGTGSFEVKGVS
jgi:type VI secretion system protein ImpF